MKRAMSIAIAAIALLIMSPATGFTRGSFHQGSFHQGSFHHGSFHHGSFHHGSFHHGSFHHGSRFFFSGGVFLGPVWDPWWWGPGWPYYSAPPALIQPSPTEYIQQNQEPEGPNYWYFCPNPEGYYPYIKNCSNGWLRVVPPSTPLNQ